MAVSTAPAREKRRTASPRKKKKKDASPLLVWWPLLLGVAVTPLTVHAASIMAIAGPSALMMLYPYVLLLKEPAFGLSGELGNNLSQLMIYLQFPLYGLAMALTLRSKSLWSAILTAAVMHVAAVLVLFLIGHMHG
jgi:hypothetical protein